ncbi:MULTISPECIES: methyl-accepting chemotaxis protein [unclassified Maridesulfovibrio]|uniref:methyl-accepting chemotaxis protein n=1 Tax=unclassified Maridesulfovibrio TaxID=2794999 RepID=UPI003B3D7098
MKIKFKMLIMVGVPVAALLLLSALGLFSLEVIKTNVGLVNTLHLDRATMIDADRDAYQAQLAMIDAERAKDAAALSQAEKSNEENQQQTWDRINGPSENFAPDMANDFADFKKRYALWKDGNSAALKITANTLEINSKRAEAKKSAMNSFGGMRDVIDKLGEMANDRALQIGPQALSSILNADRDAYQAYVAVLIIDRAQNVGELKAQVESYKENAAQTFDRVVKGADLLGYEADELKQKFIKLYKLWNTQGELYIALTTEAFADNIKKNELLVKSSKDFGAMRDSIDKLGEGEAKQVKAYIAKMEDIISSSIAIYIVVSLISIIAALALARVLSTRIATAVQESAEAATKITEGNFDIALQAKGNDEVTLLQKALNSMASTLRDNITEITAKTKDAEEKAAQAEKATARAEEAMRQAERAKQEGMSHAASELEGIVGQVASSSTQLAAQIDNSKSGAETQRVRSSETATAMEEMNASVLEVASNAGLAAEMAEKAHQEGAKSGRVVNEVVNSTKKLNQETIMLREELDNLGQQADSIGHIMSVITDIADQTNLLALNAAIEAARAGEAGRGFAVVADEVRKLAEKTVSATNEVGEAINAIQNGTASSISRMEETSKVVESSTELAGQAGEAIDGIVEMINSTNEMVQAIATASEEQSAASEQINRSVAEVDEIAVENVTFMDQASEAMRSLSEMTESLNRVISELKSK